MHSVNHMCFAMDQPILQFTFSIIKFNAFESASALLQVVFTLFEVVSFLSIWWMIYFFQPNIGKV